MSTPKIQSALSPSSLSARRRISAGSKKDAQEEIARALQAGFTAEEISAAKSGLLQSRIVARSSDNQIASDLANHLYLGRHYTWDAQFEHDIETASPDDVQKAMRKLIDPAQLITVKAGDFH